MKLKRYSYLIVLMVTLLIGINQIYADSNMCYYMSADKSTLVKYDLDKEKLYIERKDGVDMKSNQEDLINKDKDDYDSISEMDIPAVGDGCPKYIVYRYRKNGFLGGANGIWGFNDKLTAAHFASLSESGSTQITGFWDFFEDAWHTVSGNKFSAWVLSYTDSNGNIITKEEFDNNDTVNTNLSEDMTCDQLFGDKDDPNSLRYLINEILQYPKIIVPILIIVLGTLDFAKAVIASKEDVMKKAQATFIKRVLIGVVIFFVPVILDILMYFADLVWEGLGYSSCGL